MKIRTRRIGKDELYVFIQSDRPDPALDINMLEALKGWIPGKHLRYSNKRKSACIAFTRQNKLKGNG